jgi:hypothetical protein
MAINVRELRVGNWVRQLHTGRHDQVDLFMLGEIADDETYLDHLFPIPLSADLLLELGFEEMDWEHVPCYKKEMIEIEIVDGDYMARLRYDWNEGGLSLLLSTPKYLHQLMNLVYALTGKELTYTNTSKTDK